MVLRSEWQGTPPNWTGEDPCGSMWDGVTCTGSHVTSLNLSNMNLTGTIPSDVGSFVDLRALDISYNTGLAGEMPSSIGNLVSLEFLLAIGCGFSGQIPHELGNLRNLTFLALNSNKLSGNIPSSLGRLDKLYWLDLGDNELSGTLPVSNKHESGLDMLFNAKHFHLGKNRLIGPIPPEIFHCRMQLIHVLLDNNGLEGEIPTTLGLAKTLEILRLDRNSLTGTVPSNISDLRKLFELRLSNNQLQGPIPDLSKMVKLQYIDLSNNSFNPSQAPQWFTTLPRLMDLEMEDCGLSGQLPYGLFELSNIETVRLRNNYFNGSLKINNKSRQLQLVDLENNKITWATATRSNSITLMLSGNPACNSEAALSNSEICSSSGSIRLSYTTNTRSCRGKICSGNTKPNPRSCQCEFPYQGGLIFKSPSFSDLSNASRFKQLEDTLITQVYLDSVFICCLSFDNNNYLNMKVQFYPKQSRYFQRAEISRISSVLSTQTYKPPEEFGPYCFVGYSYPFKEASGSKSKILNKGAIFGVSISAGLLFGFGIIGLGFYAVFLKKKAAEASQMSNRFAWNGQESETVPKLKGARWFSLAELKNATNNFSENNVIGSGGCGKVYKGALSNGGGTVAIKRVQVEGFPQDGDEVKNEIEVLSRVHHKNLVGLMGFCLEKNEQILVYEYISNGTLRDNLNGKMGIFLNWKRRLCIAVEAARSLAYLHNHANPPIIHRDIKSTNVLLDEDLTAKVSDFGLSKFIADDEKESGGKGHISTKVKGTLGYLDPEYYMTNHLTEKSDVYSFGVVLLELITARPPIEDGKYVVREVRKALNTGGFSVLKKQLMDPLLSDSYDGLTGLENFLNLALSCVEEAIIHRPTMRDVVKELECILLEEEKQPYKSKSPEIEEISRHSSTDRDASSEYALFHYSGPYIVPTTVEPH